MLFKFRAEMPFNLIFWFNFKDSDEKSGHLDAQRGKAVAWLEVFVMMCYLI
jgi:hypothetical protein